VSLVSFLEFFFIELSLAEYYVGSLSPLAASFVDEAVQRSNRADLSRRSSCREECRCRVGQIPI